MLPMVIGEFLHLLQFPGAAVYSPLGEGAMGVVAKSRRSTCSQTVSDLPRHISVAPQRTSKGVHCTAPREYHWQRLIGIQRLRPCARDR